MNTSEQLIRRMEMTKNIFRLRRWNGIYDMAIKRGRDPDDARRLADYLDARLVRPRDTVPHG